ncbi:hypothetical protein A8F94_00795 [Bacillus sp. FJAT-27225]|uniref:hypothetical protein n=1 Tax=Bacillus sp. FJAT-27225 TaxID=1743144 RepID=UPI00080C2D47|nr:hypothetical protein [Bacillus sp. FJAT-27225]OCA90461.1 hypothetical protein A8F94_00795 [Bacillus sp. FJAT-27225]
MCRFNNNSAEIPQNPLNDLQKEISAFTVLLKDYNITFNDLTNSNPAKPEIRQEAKRVAEIINKNNDLKISFQEKKKLPIKQLQKMDASCKTTLNKYNKYITALTLMYSGKFTLLQEYISKR